MKINKITINKFKNLNNFTLDLSENFSNEHVLIGRNGLGKSNFIEALILIFRDLDLDEKEYKVKFDYEISYTCYEHSIEIKHLEGSTSIKIDNQAVTKSAFNKNKEKYLPRHIFTYYSGVNIRLQQHFERHKKRYYDNIIKETAKREEFRTLFYARNEHSNFVLLSFFSFDDDESKKFLRNYCSIDSLDSILITLKKPSWGKKTEDRFWEARGTVRQFLDILYKHALAPMSGSVDVIGEFSSNNKPSIYLYIKDQATLRLIADEYKDPKIFFQALESMYLSQLIHSIDITVKKIDDITKEETTVSFTELSEGERQLLTVVGLLKFTNQDESLYLLDEPDTHLNPLWKFKHLKIIDEILNKKTPNKSHVIIATHDAVVISGLDKESVLIFSKNDDGNITVKTPEYNPRGMGVDGVLQSDIFGLEAALDTKTYKELLRLRQLSNKKQTTPEEQEELKKLSKDLGELGFTSTTRDPLYNKFIKNLFSRPEYQGHELTKEDEKKIDRQINEILNEILEGK